MTTYKGKTVFEGYAINDIVIYKINTLSSERAFTTESQELKLFYKARKKAVIALNETFLEASEKMGKKEADLFKTHALMAEDLDFEDLVKNNIAEKQTAEIAVYNASKELSNTFSLLEDDYMKARAADVLEVGELIANNISGNNQLPVLTKPSILICDDLLATKLVKLDKKNLKGLVLVKGNVNSHVSIFARTLELPTIVAVDGYVLSVDDQNKKGIIDANSGTLIINPDEEAIKKYSVLHDKYQEELLALKNFINKPTKSKDGFNIKLFANIASAYEIANVLEKDAEGIGLFRSEFIYLQTHDYPTEELQFNYYKEVLEDMKGKEVIIRTLDIGADKKVGYFNLPYEDNPALGYRSIRICRDRPEIFMTQLRALYRASAYGNLSIMIPMIISEEEIVFVKECCEKVKHELTEKNQPFNANTRLGIMIETPAAALISDKLAKHVDFFSIGTNDLSQYTLACDRLNSSLNNTFNPYHPAILKLIKLTIENAHKAKISCGMCGELARDPKILPFLVGLHIDEISCSAAYILKTRKLISTIDSKTVNTNID